MAGTEKMRTAEAAKYLRIAVSTLARMRSSGDGPNFSKIGSRLVIYDRQDLDLWLKDRQPTPSSKAAAPLSGLKFMQLIALARKKKP